MPSTLPLLLLQFVGVLQEPPPTAATPPAAALTDLRVIVPLDRPLLVDVKRVIDCRFDVTVAGEATKAPMRIVDEWRFVDVHSVCKDDEEVCARQYLRTLSNRDGRIDDPELNGLRVDLALASGRWTAKNAGHRMIFIDHLNEIVAQAPAMSMWIALPAEAPLDGEFEVEMEALLRTLVGVGKQLEASPARVRIEALGVDPDRARLGGRVSCTLAHELRAGAIELACDLAVTLEIDRAERRLSRVRLDGKAVATSKGLMEVAGGGRVTIEMSTATGDAATAAQRAQPPVRSIERRFEKAGIGLTAPSSWFDAGNDGEREILARSFGDASGFARVELARHAEKFEPEELIGYVHRTYAGSKTENVRNQFGPAVRSTLEREGFRIVAESFSLEPGSTVTVRLLAPPSLFDDALVEFEAIRKSLKRVDRE